MKKIIEYSYTCFNDCVQSGCPTHNMQIVYNGSSDTIDVITRGHKDKNGEWINNHYEVFDRNELRALTNAFQELMK